MQKRHLLTDLLFGVQIVCALGFFVPRTIRVTSSVQGVSLGEPIALMAFAILNLSLAIEARRNRPSRIATQIVWAFWMFVALIGVLIVATLLNPGFIWKANDSQTIAIAGIGGIATVLGSRMFFGLPMTDSIVKGMVAVFMKAVPHLMWGLRIADEGSGGVPLMTIVMGHVSVAIRLTQIGIALRQEGWSRARVGQVIGEGSAEIGWIFATVAWANH